MDDNDRLLAYIQGRLDPAGAAAFEADLAARPELRAELSAMQAAKAVMDEDLSDGPDPAAGWERLSRSIDADLAGTTANDNRRRFSLAHVAGFAVASVLAWQLVAVPFLPGSDEVTFVPASEASQGPALRVIFADDARFSDIAALLDEAGATITDGPSAIGLVTLEFPDEDSRANAEAAFAARSDLVTTVTRP